MARQINHERNAWRYRKQPVITRRERALESYADRILERADGKVTK
jgi:hypothetical protein